MKCLVLKQAELYDELRVFQSGNSFGDQVLEFIHEAKDGTRAKWETYNAEGTWVPFDTKTMVQLWESISGKRLTELKGE